MKAICRVCLASYEDKEPHQRPCPHCGSRYVFYYGVDDAPFGAMSALPWVFAIVCVLGLVAWAILGACS